MSMTRSKRLNQFLKKLLHLSRSDIILSSASSLELSGSWGTSPTRSDEEDDDFWQSSAPQTPEDVPAGCLPVYVGEERRRFVIPTSYLSNSVFRALLEQSKEEYGLRCQGGLRIACAPVAFEHFLWWLDGESTSSTIST